VKGRKSSHGDKSRAEKMEAKKLLKHVKKHFLLSIVIFSLLLISCIYSSLVVPVCAQEQTSVERGLIFLTDVAGFDLTKYETIPKEYPQDSYFGVVLKENVGYNLESNTSKLKLFCTFTNKKLQILHVLEKDGSPKMTTSVTNVVDSAKDFLRNYQRYSGNPFYGELETMLEKINADKNITTTSGNINFEVNISGDYTTFKWSYTFDGIDDASKCVALGYENGFLKYFVDKWDLYKVGSTDINLSEKEAIDIAMEHAKKFSWDVVMGNDTFKINNFNITDAVIRKLIFSNSLNVDKTRGDDRLMLYPMWRIGIGLDKIYPGNVYGIYVDIWADTKEVRSVKTVFSTLPPEFFSTLPIATIDESSVGELNAQTSASEAQPNSLSIMRIIFPALFVVMLPVSLVWVGKKKNLWRSCGLPKFSFLRVGGVLVCILLFSTILLGPVSTINAASYMERATTWGSLYNKPEDEPELQDQICNYTRILFNVAGYFSSDYQGSSTYKRYFLNQIGSDANNYQRAATVWFDHGVGDTPLEEPYEDEWHFMLCDSGNNHVYDYEIYDKTGGKTFFAYISTCMSAALEIPINPDTGEKYDGTYGANTGGGERIGMPYAWTHGASLNYDGYDNPDSGQFCYIGFPYGSPSLSQVVDEDHDEFLYFNWVWEFFDSALTSDMSIKQALDQASVECFEDIFGNTDLHNDFTAKWPTCPTPEIPHCNMTVYGNSNIHLQYKTVVKAYETDNPIYTQVTVDGTLTRTTHLNFRLPPGTHTVEVPKYPDAYHVFSHFGDYPAGQNQITIEVTSDTLLWAYYDCIPQHRLTIAVGTGGTTSPQPGDYWYPAGTPVQVTAYPDDGCHFVHWAVDGGDGYISEENPITVTMDSDHTLHAFFHQGPYYISVYAFGFYNNKYYQVMPNFYIDGQPVGTAWDMYPVSYGEHIFAVDQFVPAGPWAVWYCAQPQVELFMNKNAGIVFVYELHVFG
jgi:hypothetical protein